MRIQLFQHVTLKRVWIVLIALTAIVGVSLHRQYVFFKEQSRRLSILHSSYARQICIVKRIIADTVLTLGHDFSEQDLLSTEPEQAERLLRQSLVTYLKEKGLGVDVREVERVYSSYQDRLTAERSAQKVCKPNGRAGRQSARKKKQKPLRSRISALAQRMRLRSAPKQRARLLCWPLERGTFKFSSYFGKRRRRDGSWGMHRGLDMAARRGTPVRAASDGRVIEAGRGPLFGNTILIEHANGYQTRYAHLCSINVSAGQVIKCGQVIGGVGNTGSVRSSRGGDGTHLHFEVHHKGHLVNPLYVLG